MDVFTLRTMSEHGLLLLKLVFQMQDAMQKYQQADNADRVKAAALLRKMATCLKEIYDEVKSEKPSASKHAGSMRIYLSNFEKRFSPLIGRAEAQRLKAELMTLFVTNEFEDGPMISGFLALEPNRNSGEDEFSEHVQASITSLILAYEQLEAMADVVEFE